MKMRRVWAMPNSSTFDIKPIGEFVKKYLVDSRCSVDPYARNKVWATHTNDLNPNTAAEHHMDALEFLSMLIKDGVRADLIIIDPPYSPRQMKECYDGIGIKMKQTDALRGAMMAKRNTLIAQLLSKDGVVLHFGWNTNGVGKKHNFRIEEIMLVAHGSDHNDTICMAERKL